MSAFGHAGFGSTNRRNQLRAQGQIGGQDQFGNQVRQAMQPPTMTAYSPPQSYQQNTSQQTTTNTTGARAPAQSGGPVSVGGGSPMPSPGMAQPIQPQSQGTPYGAQQYYTQERMDDIVSRANAQPKAQWTRPVGERDTEYLKQQLREALAAHPPGTRYHDWAQQEMQSMQSELARRGVQFDAQQEATSNNRKQLQDRIDYYNSEINAISSRFTELQNQRVAAGDPNKGTLTPELLRMWEENGRNKMELARLQSELSALGMDNPSIAMPGGKGADDPRLQRAGYDMYGMPGGKGADDPRLQRAGYDMYGQTGGMGRINPYG